MANEIGSVSQEGNSEIKLVLNEKSSVNSEIKSKYGDGTGSRRCRLPLH